MGLWQILGLALLAGAAIPAGGALALWAESRPRPLDGRARHGIVAFGGGALVAAVALVLVPKGSEALWPALALPAFAGGGVCFAGIDRALQRGGASKAQFLAMMTDFLPEALALGALLASESSAGPLLALLIALQNLPEGFNAFEEARGGGPRARPLLARFAALALVGPLMAWIGYGVMQDHPAVLGAVMLFAAGGILYLTFQDIAPEARVAATGVPALGAVAGFSLGLAGHLLIG